MTGDHGEGLGNHGWLHHGRHLYEEQTRVPLILYDPDSFAAATHDQVVELVDLMPTILDLLGVRPKRGRLPIQGRSLAADLRGRPAEPSDEHYAFSQRRYFGEESREDNRFEVGEKYSLVNRRYRFILQTALGDELYDLHNDRFEIENLVGQNLAQEISLRKRLLERIQALESQALPESRTVHEEAIRQLRSLGYLQ